MDWDSKAATLAMPARRCLLGDVFEDVLQAVPEHPVEIGQRGIISRREIAEGRSRAAGNRTIREAEGSARLACLSPVGKRRWLQCLPLVMRGAVDKAQAPGGIASSSL
jgi:hypothetical protein